MKNIIVVMIVIAILAIVSVLFAQSINTDKEQNINLKDIPKELLAYVSDSEYYNYWIMENPDKIIIKKDAKKFDATANFNTYVKSTLGINTYLDSNPECIKRESIGIGNNNLSVFDLSSIKENNSFDYLYILKGNDNIIWSELKRKIENGTVFDFKKIDNTYIVLSVITNKIIPKSMIDEELCIDFIDGKKLNDKEIVSRYKLPCSFYRSFNTGHITELPIIGKILTDNIIRLEYKDGAIEHWKVKLSKEDFAKNKENRLKNGNQDTGAKQRVSYVDANALIWWNGIGKGSPVDHIKAKAWDYDEDTGKEPTYE